jgi:hypothetical protein
MYDFSLVSSGINDDKLKYGLMYAKSCDTAYDLVEKKNNKQENK